MSASKRRAASKVRGLIRRSSRKVIAESTIAKYPPRDGREWDGQCARCGSSVAKFTRPYGECLSGEVYCQANPIKGREAVERGQVEWFTFDARTTEIGEIEQ